MDSPHTLETTHYPWRLELRASAPVLEELEVAVTVPNRRNFKLVSCEVPRVAFETHWDAKRTYGMSSTTTLVIVVMQDESCEFDDELVIGGCLNLFGTHSMGAT